MTVRLAVFDCDGTLLDSQHNIVAAMDACFTRNRLTPPSANTTRRIVGLSLPQAMAALLPEAEEALHAQLADDYKLCFQEMRADASLAHEPLYDGALEALEALAAQGWLLGIATGKSDRGLAHALEVHGIAERFCHAADGRPAPFEAAPLHAAAGDARRGCCA